MHIRLNGHDTFYELIGAGTPVMVMHGGGLDHESLRPWLAPLGDQGELIFYDQYGLGRSDRPADYSGITNDTWVEQAEALRQFLGHEKILVLGHSYGGYIALEYALKYPARVAGLVLVSTAAVLDYAADVLAEAAARSSPEQFEAVMALFHHPAAVSATRAAVSPPRTDDDLAKLWRAVLPVYTWSLAPSAAEQLLGPVVFSAGGHNYQVDVLLPRYDVSARLAEIAVPVLVMTGAKDFITTPAAARRIQAGIRDSELFIFERSGHFPYVEERELFLREIRSWLASRYPNRSSDDASGR
jgi:proline iminopeptidase